MLAKGKVVFSALGTIAVIIGVIIAIMPEKEKEFSAGGITITLTTAFKEEPIPGYVLSCSSAQAAVSAYKETFNSIEKAGDSSDITLEEYAKFLMEMAEIRSTVRELEGFTTFEFTEIDNGDSFTYLVVVLKSHDAFWFIEYLCETSNISRLRPQFLEWSKTIRFN